MSTESKRWSITIGILAMVFSSVGTGTSALNSFYNPREAFIRHQRSLSMLKQSHMVLATEVTGEINADGCTRMDGDRGQRVKDWSREWSRRLALILTVSDTTAQGDSKGPGDGKRLRPGESGGSITVENGLPPSS
jgi:hypothetical protein